MEAWFLLGWLLGRETGLLIYLQAKTQQSPLFSFSLCSYSTHLLSGNSSFFIHPFLLLLLHNPLFLPSSSLPAMLQKLPLLIHKNALHTWLSSRGTGAWFNSPAHTHTFPCLYTLLPAAFLTPPPLAVYLLQTALSFSRHKGKARSICVLLCINSQSRSSPLAQKDIRETNINIVFWPLWPLFLATGHDASILQFFVFIRSMFHTTCNYCGYM